MVIIYLDRPLPACSSDTTRRSAGNFIPSLFGLAPDGVYLAGKLPYRWCALTAPFHPYHLRGGTHFCGTVPKVTFRPDVIRHPALRSSDFPPIPSYWRLPFILIAYYHTLSLVNPSRKTISKLASSLDGFLLLSFCDYDSTDHGKGTEPSVI